MDYPKDCTHRKWQVVDKRQVHPADEAHVELVVAHADPTQALEPAEEAVDLVVAPTAQEIVGPGPTGNGLGGTVGS